MKKYFTLMAFVWMFIASSFSLAESAHLPQKGNSTLQDDLFINIRLASHSVAITDDDLFIFVGNDANASPTDSTIKAVMCCTDYVGSVLWKYEMEEVNAKSSFFDVSITENQEVQTGYLVLYPNGTREQFLLTIKDGELISQKALDPSASLITADDKKLVIQTLVASTEKSGYCEYQHALTAFSPTFEKIWHNVYSDNFMLRGILPIQNGYIIFGSTSDESGGIHQYIACLDTVGKYVWHHITPYKNACYLDAIEADNEDIIVVGGVYAANDGTSFPTAQIACYSVDGEKKWEKEENYGELGILFDSIASIPGGYIAAGANAVEKSSVRIVRYDENGTKVAAWDEPLNENLNYVEHLELQTMNGAVYLVVTADYQTDTSDEVEDHIIYRTMIKKLSYEFPL